MFNDDYRGYLVYNHLKVNDDKIKKINSSKNLKQSNSIKLIQKTTKDDKILTFNEIQKRHSFFLQEMQKKKQKKDQKNTKQQIDLQIKAQTNLLKTKILQSSQSMRQIQNANSKSDQLFSCYLNKSKNSKQQLLINQQSNQSLEKMQQRKSAVQNDLKEIQEYQKPQRYTIQLSKIQKQILEAKNVQQKTFNVKVSKSSLNCFQKEFNYDYWKKKNRIPEHKKVFYVQQVYQGLKNYLLNMGWHENPCSTSNYFDFKWTLTGKELDYDNLQEFQIVNHFQNNIALTTKIGLCQNIKEMIWYCHTDPYTFFPKCFDLSEQEDFENFQREFKLQKAQSVLIKFLNDKYYFYNRENMVQTAMNVCERLICDLDDIIDDKKYIFGITESEWLILRQDEEKINRFVTKQQIDSDETEKINKIKTILDQLKTKYPQSSLVGPDNIWIMKPSQGRGIECFKSLLQIEDFLKLKDNNWVVQKYIENPLIIKNKKFDIRIWVLVTDWLFIFNKESYGNLVL